ncbi:uncharacterized protein LOC126810234 [Patella vulgata]|uniref:uncharacterized protein LOC126810234 n=1 Tax=Patella vulgata TaxID=6465 RepID=UPI0024A98E14|nr:uncharacterized protein LOC126810234 [Patella vulgata]
MDILGTFPVTSSNACPKGDDCRYLSGCYERPGSPCSKHTLTCDEGQVISIDERNEIRKIHYGTKINTSCNTRLDTTSCKDWECCRKHITDLSSPVNLDYRLQVYKNCSNKRTCSLTSPFTPGTDYDYIYYPYICIPVSSINNLAEITNTSINRGDYLYISGKTPSFTKCCNITNQGGIQVETRFIRLSAESSKRVQITPGKQTLFRCGEEVFIDGRQSSVIRGNQINIVIDNLPTEGDDVIWIKINSSSTVTCDDCSRHLVVNNDECHVEFGCYGNSGTEHTLTCDEGQVIAIDERNEIRKIHYGTKNQSCPFKLNTNQCYPTPCSRNSIRNLNDRLYRLEVDDEQYRMEVYRNCSNKPRCSLRPPINISNIIYDYIYYPYTCISVSSIHDLGEITNTSINSGDYLYITGKTPSFTKCCNITNQGQIQVETRFIRLSAESSKRVQITPGKQTLFKCGEEVFIDGRYSSVIRGNQINIVIDNLPAEGDDVIWIKINSSSTITCDDCFRHLVVNNDECHVEFGCYGESGKQHTLTCDDGQVMSIDERDEIRKIHYGTKITPSCPFKLNTNPCNPTSCSRNGVTNLNGRLYRLEVDDEEYRLEVYRNCSNKPRCSLRPPVNISNIIYDYIYYPYTCISGNTSTDTDEATIPTGINNGTGINNTVNNKDNDVNTGLLVAVIVMAAVILAACLIGGIYFIRRKRKHNETTQAIQDTTNTDETYSGLANRNEPEHNYSGLVISN